MRVRSNTEPFRGRSFRGTRTTSSRHFDQRFGNAGRRRLFVDHKNSRASSRARRTDSCRSVDSVRESRRSNARAPRRLPVSSSETSGFRRASHSRSQSCRTRVQELTRSSVYDPYVVLRARIDFERTCKLAAESRHFDSLTRTQATDVDASRSADERMNLARAIVYEDDESERQIIDDWLRDRSRYLDDLAFGSLTDVAGCN